MAFRFAGPIRMESAAASLSVCVAAIDAGETELDLDGLVASDSSAVAVLIAARRHAKSGGRTVRLSGVPQAVLSLAALYGVEQFVAD